MHIAITDNTTFGDIQEVFADFYPYLRIEFYKRAHRLYEPSREIDWIGLEQTVGQVRQTPVSGLLEIRPLEKAGDVEKEFQERFGLPVQVLVQEKDRWVQTTGMDDFTLKDLNELGRSSSDEFILADDEEGFEDNIES